MSVVQPAKGATVVVDNGLLVVNRTPGFVGASTFSFVAMGADGTPITVSVVVHVLGESFAAPTLPFTGADALELADICAAECERRPRWPVFDLARPVDEPFIWS